MYIYIYIYIYSGKHRKKLRVWRYSEFQAGHENENDHLPQPFFYKRTLYTKNRFLQEDQCTGFLTPYLTSYLAS